MKCVKCKMPISTRGLDRCFCPPEPVVVSSFPKVMSREDARHRFESHPDYNEYKQVCASKVVFLPPVESVRDLPDPPAQGVTRILTRAQNYLYESFNGSAWYLAYLDSIVESDHDKILRWCREL